MSPRTQPRSWLPTARDQAARRPRTVRPRLELLEDRAVPAVLGDFDTTFGPQNGKVTLNFGGVDKLNAVAIQDDGKIVVAGTDGRHFKVERLLDTGAPDPSFGTAGNGFSVDIAFGGNVEVANGLVIDPTTQAIYVVGSSRTDGGSGGISTDSDFAVATLKANGTLDNVFGGTGRSRPTSSTTTRPRRR